MKNLAGLLGKDKRFARGSYTEGLKGLKDELTSKGVEITVDDGKGEYRVFYDGKNIDDDTKELIAIFGQMVKGFPVFADTAKKYVADSAVLVSECERYLATAKFDFADDKRNIPNVEKDLKTAKKNMQSAPKNIEKLLSAITKLNSAVADNFTIGKGKGTPVGVPTGKVSKKSKTAIPAKRDISVYVYSSTKYTYKYSGEGTNADSKLIPYDETISKAHDITEFVVKFEKDTAKFMQNLANILGKDKRFTRGSFADGLKVLKDDLTAMGIVLTVSEVAGEFKVSATKNKAGEKLSDIEKEIALAFEKVIKSLPSFADKAKKSIGDSVVIIPECDRYLATAKFDFAADKAKVANVEKDLKTAKKNMQSVSKRLEKLVGKVQELNDAIKNTLK
jgi:polyhydroxyalkanoate synthesis regulator phasin